ncbi:MAG: hypothetical protein HOO67_02335 [Candidatus Peribacteraceae bacterium]|nr:hypothetical protein [Candidatus Peribacteraceae bacterium]
MLEFVASPDLAVLARNSRPVESDAVETIGTNKKKTLRKALQGRDDIDTVCIQSPAEAREYDATSVKERPRSVRLRAASDGNARREDFVRRGYAVILGKHPDNIGVSLPRLQPHEQDKDEGWITHAMGKDADQACADMKRTLTWLLDFLQEAGNDKSLPVIRIHIESMYGVDSEIADVVTFLEDAYHIIVSSRDKNVESAFEKLQTGARETARYSAQTDPLLETLPDLA